MEKTGFTALNRTEKAFFALVRAGLWEKNVDDLTVFPLKPAEWREVYRMAQEQTVSALTFQGVCQLPEEMMPEELMLQKWLMLVEVTERSNELMNGVIAEFLALMKQNSVYPVILKGQGVAAFYEQPLLRSCGDIDLFFPVPGDEEKARGLMRAQGCRPEKMPDNSYSYSWRGVEFEHHTCMFDIQNPSCRPFLKKLMDMEGFDGHYPTPMLNLLLLNAHILKHVLGHGIGVRQLADIARAYHTLHGKYDEQVLEQIYRETGIYRWSCQLHAFLVNLLGLDKRMLPFTERDCLIIPALLHKILKGGNFGKHGDSRGAESQGTWMRKWHTFRAFTADLRLSLELAPKETFWTVWKLTVGQFE